MLTAPPANCTAIDLIFVLDASGSIDSSGFEQMKLLVSQIVNSLDIESDNVRVGLLTYSTTVDARFNLSTYSTRAQVRAATHEVTYSAGRTNTAEALAHVRQVMLQPAAGARAHVPNVVVVMTDAGSTDKRTTQVSFVTLLYYQRNVVINYVLTRTLACSKTHKILQPHFIAFSIGIRTRYPDPYTGSG